MKKIFLRLSSFFYPVVCSLCGETIAPELKCRICADCKKSLPKIEGYVCAICGLPLKEGGEHCYACRKNPKAFRFDKMRSAYLYEGAARTLILKFKYYGRMFLAADLAEEMFEVFKKNDFFKNADIIIPVPLNILRRIKRGYNQAALLALELGKKASIPVNCGILIRKKITKPQFRLGKKEREKNIKDSFSVKNGQSVKNKKILLVDDIATTSATACACAKTLKEAGAGAVYVITLARG